MPITSIKKKSNFDKFYTKEEIAECCFSMLKKYCDDIDLFIEPSAGSGAFVKCCTKNLIAIDIEPENEEILKFDWFDFDFSEYEDCNICVFGNPPFGNRSNLAKRFIKHATDSKAAVKIIGFVLPEVFEKETYQKCFDAEWSLVESVKLPKNSFTLDNKDYNVPCVFQIWIKHYNLNKRKNKITVNECSDFEIVKKTDNPDMFVFGAAPNKIINPEQVKSTNRGYYLKCKIPKENVVEKISSIDWKKYGKSSVSGGVFWLTKSEFIGAYCNE